MKRFINFLVIVYVVILGITCLSSQTVEMDMKSEWAKVGEEFLLVRDSEKIYKERQNESEKILLNKGEVVTINQKLSDEKSSGYVEIETGSGEIGYIHTNPFFEEFEKDDDSNTLKTYRKIIHLVDKIFIWGMDKVSSPITILIVMVIIVAILIFLDEPIDNLLENMFGNNVKDGEMYFDFIGYKLMPISILVGTSMAVTFSNSTALDNFLIKGLDFNIIKGGYSLENMMNIGVILSIIATIAIIIDIFINYSLLAGIFKFIYILILNVVSSILVGIILGIVVIVFIVKFIAPFAVNSISIRRRYY